MGNDGHTSGNNTSIMPDVFGYSLGYFGADYEPIGTGLTAFGSSYSHPAASSPGDITGKALFNGNISQATYAIGLLNNGETVGNSYQYDQLNRLLRVNRHTAITAGSSWSNGSIAAPFGENFSYDANGNIIALTRNNNTGQVLDQLSYSYNRNELGKLINNKLRDVQDPSRPQITDNYTYDEIGNLTADEAEGLASISWTVYGKIRQITKTNGSTITYSYDPSGNRVRKVVTQAGGSNPQTTFYTRDAQGNTMAVYEQSATTYKWAEQHLYGSSRLGIFKPAFEVASSQPLGSDEYSDSNDPAANGIFGKKFFELSNHLGNVMVSVSDRTVQQMVGGNLVYRAEELSAQDYYAFGGLMPGRQVSVSDYRYGFNGQEMSNEIKSVGNSYTAEFWEYDPRLGRRWNVDPVLKVDESPYFTFGGNPILNADPKGDDWYQKGKEFKWFKGSGTQQGYTHLGKNYRYISKNQTIVTLFENQEGTKGLWKEESPRDEFEKAIIKGKYYYSNNYGWVDKTHAFYKSKKGNVGANKLWDNVNRAADGNTGNEGFITYTQDAKVLSFRVGVTRYYSIDQGISLDKRREAALAIMKDVSYRFEYKQGYASSFSNSSFEISDLPSNVLGLYMAMYNLSQPEIESLIKPLSRLQSIDIYRANPWITKMKNYTFSPILIPNKYSPQSSSVPEIFKSVKPAKIGHGGDTFIHPSSGPTINTN